MTSQNKSELVKFFIKYNVIYLGSLTFFYLFVHVSLMVAWRRHGYGDAWEYYGLFYLVRAALFLIAVISWIYGFIETWRLTRGSRMFNKSRIFGLLFLIGAPTLLVFASRPVGMMMYVTVGPFVTALDALK